MLVRDEFPGKRIVNGLIDLPFALPTIVAGLVLLALYGPNGPVGINVAYTRVAVVLALLFVTLPFVVRAVQPVLMGLEREAEEAAESLGAKPWTIFRRIILPALRPAMLAGVGLAFGRAVGEFGSIVLISGNLPYKTEVASVLVYGQIESGNTNGAAAVSVLLLVGLVPGAADHLVRGAQGDRAMRSRHRARGTRRALLPGGADRRPGRDGLLPRVRERLRRRLGRGDHAAGPARVLPHHHDHADRGAAQRRSSAW